MKLVRNIRALRCILRDYRRRAKTIGFVPTMGYLHEGHLSLVRQADRDTDVVVLSIYVNPKQFAPQEDFARYPRDLKRDMKLAKAAGVDIVFVPSDKEMYPQNYSTYVNVEQLSNGLCGKTRKGHFKGVATIVAKLFNIVHPDIAYFGQKDAQQSRIIQRMVRDLNMDIRIKIMPIVREADGLAISSRNAYLNRIRRKNALCLYQSLLLAKEMLRSGKRSSREIVCEMKKNIEKKGSYRIEYIEIVNNESLKPLKKIKGKVLIALAVWVGKTRLIDNIIVNVREIVRR